MTDSAQTLPVPGAVGELYDQLTLNAMKDGTFNPNVHIGYWDTPDSEASIDEAMDRLTDVFIERMGVDDSSHVLDLGCGVGGPGLRVVAHTGARVTGISISAEQIKTANRLADQAGVADRAVFRHGDAMKLPFADGSFDAVMALESICHMPDRQQVLTEVCRVLVPGGRLVLTDVFERAPRKDVRHPGIDKFCRSLMATMADVDDYAALLHRSGLRLRGILDVTEQTTLRTGRELVKMAGAEDRPAALDESNFHFTDDAFHPSDLAGVDDFGCLLVTAERP
ncbi:methyltransferase domain-containing protein [Streptomyces sp. HNM0663]|uniref:Methyltransferase domain-containing protein n=1 Tax=Streptomyces chengmaiensis TaxID=3040919 RepID=A0ABT6HGH8_9ACTN|nr:methyltransferase domain-containing protein [Streptomyces chengmaiensis]MDH2387868.1 methyltransferase domain-containing protein [Streptomyces chengmaiensis]